MKRTSTGETDPLCEVGRHQYLSPEWAIEGYTRCLGLHLLSSQTEGERDASIRHCGSRCGSACSKTASDGLRRARNISEILPRL